MKKSPVLLLVVLMALLMSCKSTQETIVSEESKTEAKATKEKIIEEDKKGPEVNTENSPLDQKFEKENKELIQRLNLTEKQKKDYQAVIQSYNQKRREMKRESEGDEEMLTVSLQGLQPYQDEEIQSILDENQYAIYLHAMQERRARPKQK